MKNSLVAIIFFSCMGNIWGQTPLSQAENIKLTDIDGKFHNLMTYLDKGQYVLLDFFSVTCSSCAWLASSLDTVYQHYNKNTESLVILGIDKTFDNDMLRQFAEENNVTYPLASGSEGGGLAAFNIYQIPYYPCMVLIAPDKTILSPQLPHTLSAYGIIDSLKAYGISHVGIEEYAAKTWLQLYPNPATDKLTISTSHKNKKHCYEHLSIYNSTGQEIHTENIITHSFPIHINIAKLPTGLYYIQLSKYKATTNGLAFIKQ